jgi:hypothetical protein
MLKRICTWIIIIGFFSQNSHGQVPTAMQGLGSGGSEFFVGRIEGKPLITVNLISGVRLPGVYHIPIQTNLVQLIAFAGGAGENADFENVTIRTQASSGATTTKKIDLDEILKDSQGIPVMQDRDTIRIPPDVDYIGKSLTYIALIGSTLGVILSAIAVENSRR